MLKRIRRQLLLNKIARLEHNEHFIDPFFCGETNYPIEKAKNEAALEAAKNKLAQL